MSIILIHVRRCVVWRGFGLCRNSVTVSMLKSRNARQFVSHKFSLLFYIIRNAFVVWLVGLLGSVAQFFFRLFFFSTRQNIKENFFRFVSITHVGWAKEAKERAEITIHAH